MPAAVFWATAAVPVVLFVLFLLFLFLFLLVLFVFAYLLDLANTENHRADVLNYRPHMYMYQL